jgi:uncharacterized membrane protein YfcA
VTNTVAVLPGYVGGACGYRRELSERTDDVRRLAPVAVLGAVAGAVAILTTSQEIFDGIVPVLVLLASLLLAAQPRIQRWVLSRDEDGFARSRFVLLASTFLASAYGAYFGGGLGVVLLAVLGVFLALDIQRLNAIKSALTLTINAVATVAFALFGPVQWVAVAIMAPMSLLGGWVGASLARRMHPSVLRWSVAGFGVVVAVLLAIT